MLREVGATSIARRSAASKGFAAGELMMTTSPTASHTTNDFMIDSFDLS